MDKVLLVEDSVEFQLMVRRSLESSELSVALASSVAEVERLIAMNEVSYGLAILDLSLPDGDGFEVLEKLRRAGMGKETPVFFLTSETELKSKVTAFHLGADDYLIKPISPVELKARVEMRLAKVRALHADRIERGDLTVDLTNVTAFRNDGGLLVDLSLTGKEFKLLSFLIRSENHIFSRIELVEAVWGKGLHILDRTVDSHIYGLRKKMGPVANYIESIPQAGYKFALPVSDPLSSVG